MPTSTQTTPNKKTLFMERCFLEIEGKIPHTPQELIQQLADLDGITNTFLFIRDLFDIAVTTDYYIESCNSDHNKVANDVFRLRILERYFFYCTQFVDDDTEIKTITSAKNPITENRYS